MRKQYDDEFKKSAVEKFQARGDIPARQIAEELDVPLALLAGWNANASRKNGKKKPTVQIKVKNGRTVAVSDVPSDGPSYDELRRENLLLRHEADLFKREWQTAITRDASA